MRKNGIPKQMTNIGTFRSIEWYILWPKNLMKLKILFFFLLFLRRFTKCEFNKKFTLRSAQYAVRTVKRKFVKFVYFVALQKNKYKVSKPYKCKFRQWTSLSSSRRKHFFCSRALAHGNCFFCSSIEKRKARRVEKDISHSPIWPFCHWLLLKVVPIEMKVCEKSISIQIQRGF